MSGRKIFDAGACRIAAGAAALPFELKPKPALSRRLVSAKQREDGNQMKAETVT
jgi:hypothetical protein